MLKTYLSPCKCMCKASAEHEAVQVSSCANEQGSEASGRSPGGKSVGMDILQVGFLGLSLYT